MSISPASIICPESSFCDLKLIPIQLVCASLAQWIERSAPDRKAAGSIPVGCIFLGV